jgi:hypothetical protein
MTEVDEYQTPLLKIICGLLPDTPLLHVEELLKATTDECLGLLEAVIAHAPVFGELSIDGFRGSYLIRPGLLTIRDGHWLVQVERRGYDILLNKIPWSFNLMKLPWLNRFIVSEWI